MEENTNSLRKKTEELYKQSKFEEIIALLTDEVLETQKDAELYAWRARVNNRLDKDVVATMIFAEKAIATNPTYFMGYFARALVWDDKKENDIAITDYSKAIVFNPDFADAYYNRGLVWQNLNDYNKAIADFDKAIVNYNKAIEINPKDAELYGWKGNACYNKGDYKTAIADYTKAIELNPDFADAYYYNSGLAWFAEKKYPKAIADYTKVINLNSESKYADAYYYVRGLAWKAKGKYKEAINDYTEAIIKNPAFANAYYSRGLAKKEKDVDLEESKQDFEKYLKLTTDENEIWTKYAKSYIEELNEKIKYPDLRPIIQLVNDIKNKLMITEGWVTHYTSLSVLENLILDNSKFRISEGNFTNDPSEGKEFFDFMQYKPYTSTKSGSFAKTFSRKPFIGSFVTKDKHNDLNMWRFYGKEKGMEAKGCAITLHKQKFIDYIKDSLSNEKNKEARLEDESNMKFYRVVYIQHKSTDFYIPNLNQEKIKELKGLMAELKEKVEKYTSKVNDRTSLEKYLNRIAFLFKSDAYKNENEVRLVVEGREFEKKYNMDLNTPKVYIELVPIKDIVSQITFGPKVDKKSEWIAAFHYRYEEEEKAPKIRISHLPYK